MSVSKDKAQSLLAALWWGQLSDHQQQLLADRYYPGDDFMKTHTHSVRVRHIYVQELQRNDT